MLFITYPRYLCRIYVRYLCRQTEQRRRHLVWSGLRTLALNITLIFVRRNMVLLATKHSLRYSGSNLWNYQCATGLQFDWIGFYQKRKICCYLYEENLLNQNQLSSDTLSHGECFEKPAYYSFNHLAPLPMLCSRNLNSHNFSSPHSSVKIHPPFKFGAN